MTIPGWTSWSLETVCFDTFVDSGYLYDLNLTDIDDDSMINNVYSLSETDGKRYYVMPSFSVRIFAYNNKIVNGRDDSREGDDRIVDYNRDITGEDEAGEKIGTEIDAYYLLSGSDIKVVTDSDYSSGNTIEVNILRQVADSFMNEYSLLEEAMRDQSFVG